MSRWSERFEALTKGVDTKDTSDTCHRSDESESLGVKAVLGVNALETPTSAPVPPQSSIETTSAFLGSDSVDTCDSFDTSASSKIVVLDFETRNTGDVKLKAAGAWRYAADPATEILTATYHTDGEHHLWTPATGKRGPLASLAADSDTTFVCFSNFEIAVWEKIMVERFGFPPVPIDRWHDVQATCAYHALPRDLERALAALEMPVAKDKEGRRLVLALSRPSALPKRWQESEAASKPNPRSSSPETVLNIAAADVKAGVILADPPWTFATYSRKGKGRSAEAHYDCMSLADIKALPVGDWAAPDCALFLWITDPSLPQALEVIAAWGFEYKTVAFTWAKQTKSGKWHFGMGKWTRANPEQCLLATRGNPHRLSASVRQLIVAPLREHSRKPDEVYERVETLVAGPYLELFARVPREGWSSWGHEVAIGPTKRRWASNSYPDAFPTSAST